MAVTTKDNKKGTYKRKDSTPLFIHNEGIDAFNALSGIDKELWTQSEDHKKLFIEITNENVAKEKLEKGFCYEVLRYMNERGYEVSDFVKKTLRTDRYYRDIKNNKIKYPQKETVLAICIGLDIWGSAGEEFFKASGINMNDDYIVYKNILHHFKYHDIYKCDEIVQYYGLPSIIQK